MSTFEAWPKIPRWNREVVVTEKIDGTNAAIIVEHFDPIYDDVEPSGEGALAKVNTYSGWA